MKWDVYTGLLKLHGEQYGATLIAANNYAWGLFRLQHFEEAKALLRKTMPVARRVLGESHQLTLMMRQNYAEALLSDPDATLGDVREAVTTLEDLAPTARRVLGGAHPLTKNIEGTLRGVRASLRARETPSSPSGSA